MKYLVFRVLTGGDLYVYTHMCFHDHLCHIEVAEANKKMVASAFTTHPEFVDIIGAGFVEFDALGSPRCYGYSDSLNIHSRGELDSEVMRATMLQLDTKTTNKLEELFGEFDQCRRATATMLAALEDKAFVLTKRASVIIPGQDEDEDDCAACVKAFTVITFRRVVAHRGQSYFVFDENGKEYLFKYGVLSTLLHHDQMTCVLERLYVGERDNRFWGVTFTCNVPDYGLEKGDKCSLQSVVFEDDHDPFLASVAVGTVKLTVNGIEQEVEMRMTDLCHMVYTGQEEE